MDDKPRRQLVGLPATLPNHHQDCEIANLETTETREISGRTGRTVKERKGLMKKKVKPSEGMDFASFVLDLSYGEVNIVLGEKLEQLVAAVNETGKAGALTIKFGVKKEGTMAVAHCDVTVKLPEPALPGTMFFFGKEGKSMHREDPRQLTLKEIATPSMKVVGDDDEDGGNDD